MQAAELWNVVFAKATVSLHVLWKFAAVPHNSLDTQIDKENGINAVTWQLPTPVTK